MPPDSDLDFIRVLREALGRPEKLMELLGALCGEVRADAAPGATRIGAESDLTTRAGLEKAAAVYHSAFEQEKPAFPYFAAESAGDRR